MQPTQAFFKGMIKPKKASGPGAAATFLLKRGGSLRSDFICMKSIFNMDQQKISLNVHLQVPTTTTSPPGTMQDGSHTPNTPEILNTIVNMTSSPFASEFLAGHLGAPALSAGPVSKTTSTSNTLSLNTAPSVVVAPEKQETSATMHEMMPISEHVYSTAETSMDHHEQHSVGLSYSDISTMDTTTTSSNLSSPSTPSSSFSSVQAYTSQFIKEGLKIKMRQRIGSGSSTTSFSKELPSPSTPKPAPRSKGTKRVKLEDLSPDDFVKRQRRRERNKIAATKCRNKKKARSEEHTSESSHITISYAVFCLKKKKKKKTTKRLILQR